MTAWKESKADTVKKLKDSADMAFVKSGLVACGLCVVILTVMCLLVGKAEYWIGVGIATAVVLVPFLAYYLRRVYCIFRCAESYSFCRATLSQLHPSEWRRTMYFTVAVEDMDGGQFFANTRAIFHTHGLAAPQLEDYNNKTVTIGYNEETGEVVVID